MSELIIKPCPFCGFSPKTFDYDGLQFVQCIEPDCKNDATMMHVSRWNERPIEDALRERILDLEIEVIELNNLMGTV